jgi:hypothetical protein
LKIPNQNPYIEEQQTTQWPKEKGQTMMYKTLHRKLKIEQHVRTQDKTAHMSFLFTELFYYFEFRFLENFFF